MKIQGEKAVIWKCLLFRADLSEIVYFRDYFLDHLQIVCFVVGVVIQVVVVKGVCFVNLELNLKVCWLLIFWISHLVEEAAK